MSTLIITACPTMANPDAFTDINELREELHRSNDSILQLADQNHELKYVLQGVSHTLARVVAAHIDGKHDFVKRELDDIVAKHVKIVQKPEGAVH